MKYEVGDKVMIVKDRTFNMNEDGDMDCYLGSIMTISKCEGLAYRMVEDGGEWFWHDSMIERNLKFHGVDNEDALLRIQDNFAAISNTVSDINYLIQERLEDIDQEEYLDNKVIMSLERISREVSDCYEILDNHKL